MGVHGGRVPPVRARALTPTQRLVWDAACSGALGKVAAYRLGLSESHYRNVLCVVRRRFSGSRLTVPAGAAG